MNRPSHEEEKGRAGCVDLLEQLLTLTLLVAERSCLSIRWLNSFCFSSSLTIASFIVYVGLFTLSHAFLDDECPGGNGAFDLMWFSNMSVFIAALGMISRRPLLIGTAISCASFAHLSFIYDTIHWILFEHVRIGRAAFAENPECSLWFTTLHQLFLIPLCFFVLNRDFPGVGLRWKSFRNSLFLGVVFSAIATAFFNEMFANLSRLTTGDHSLYNFVTGHEFWIVPETNLLAKSIDDGFFVAWLWSIFIESIFLNGICFLFLKAISLLLLEDIHKVSKD